MSSMQKHLTAHNHLRFQSANCFGRLAVPAFSCQGGVMDTKADHNTLNSYSFYIISMEAII